MQFTPDDNATYKACALAQLQALIQRTPVENRDLLATLNELHDEVKAHPSHPRLNWYRNHGPFHRLFVEQTQTADA